MKTIFLTLTAIFFLLSASCTDFFNSKNLTPTNDSINFEKTENFPFPEGYNPHQGSFSKEKMLANIGVYVLYPITTQLRLNSELLSLSIQQWLQSPDLMARANQAQLNWKNTMLSYHFLDAAPLGPLSDPGLRLGEKIYSWPYMNLCGVDHEVLKAKELKNQYQVPELFTLKGLAVLEYLLFDEALQSACNPRNPRNQVVIDWTSLPDLVKKQDRLFYAKLISDDLIKNTKALEKYFDPNQYNFTYRLIQGQLNLTLKEAVNSLSDAMFSIERIKDQKVGKPLGLYKECLSEDKKCPEAIEHPWSDISFEAIDAQLRGFESLFLGRDLGQNYNGFGFDDFLIEMNRPNVSEEIQQSLQQIYISLKQVQELGSFDTQVKSMDVISCQNSTSSSRIVPVCSLFHDIRNLANLMKTDFLIALSLRSPPTYQGDND